MKNIINAKRKKRRKQKQKQYQITKTKRRRNKKTRKGNRLFPNRSDLAYAGRNTVNQEVYHAAKLTKKASTELNLIIKQRIDQFISRGGREVERILPKIIRGAIEDIYQTTFRLLENFGKKQCAKIKRQWVRPNYATIHHHPPPAKICPPPPTTSQICPPPPTTTHHQPKYIHRYLPFPKKWNVTPQKPKYIHI